MPKYIIQLTNGNSLITTTERTLDDVIGTAGTFAIFDDACVRVDRIDMVYKVPDDYEFDRYFNAL